MGSSSFCCEDCGSVHLSEYTALDTFCPKCTSPRSRQHLLLCTWCSMPLEPEGEDGWRHCGGDGLGCSDPCLQPSPGIRVSVYHRGRRCLGTVRSAVGRAISVATDGGELLRYTADSQGRFYPPGSRRTARWVVRFIGKTA